MNSIRAVPRYQRTIEAVSELLGKLRIDAMFVGSVAGSAWLGHEVAAGAVDLIAVLKAEQKNQVAMMASHRGFRVDRDEVEATEELDLIPLNYADPEGEVRVHVLVATNALYGRMVAAAKTVAMGERELRIPQAEDFALLLTMAEAEGPVQQMLATEGFDRRGFEERLVSIGLGGRVRKE